MYADMSDILNKKDLSPAPVLLSFSYYMQQDMSNLSLQSILIHEPFQKCEDIRHTF